MLFIYNKGGMFVDNLGQYIRHKREQKNITIEELSNETTLKGLFIKEILLKMNDKNISEEEKEKLEKAVEIGLEALN